MKQIEETKKLKVEYVRKRYEKIIRDADRTRSCLSSVIKSSYILQGVGTILGLTLTTLPSIENVLIDFKLVLIGVAAGNALVGGIVAVLLQLERRKRSAIENNIKAIARMLEILDDNEVSKSELDTVIELDNADK